MRKRKVWQAFQKVQPYILGELDGKTGVPENFLETAELKSMHGNVSVFNVMQFSAKARRPDGKDCDFTIATQVFLRALTLKKRRKRNFTTVVFIFENSNLIPQHSRYLSCIKNELKDWEPKVTLSISCFCKISRENLTKKFPKSVSVYFFWTAPWHGCHKNRLSFQKNTIMQRWLSVIF